MIHHILCVIVTPVFVQKGHDLLLKLHADPPEGVLYVDWKINKTVDLVRFKPSGESHVDPRFTGRVQLDENKFSVILKNVQEVDSGVYSAVAATPTGDKLLTEYKVTVQVSPLELVVDRVDSNSSESCDLHVTCRTHNSNISSTFRCSKRVCSQEGGERSEVTTSGASLQVYLLKNVIICIHSNQVHRTHDLIHAEQLCYQNDFINNNTPNGYIIGRQSTPSSPVLPSVFLVKMVVFSVGLIIMVSAVITVHLVDFKKHQQRKGCQTRHAAREESSHLKVTF
uniref:Immunoglobulin V-set domain-containing protein n=1 Tax=Gasterosteus aculeatus aculeatus TaxID=481459 RepID=G3N787_GASAC